MSVVFVTSTIGQAVVTSPTNTKTSRVLAVVLGTIGLGIVVFTVAQSILRSLGTVSPVVNILTILISVLTTAISLIVANQQYLDGAVPWWGFVVAFGALVAIVAVGLVVADDTRAFAGELTDSVRVEEHHLDLAGGDRVVLVLESFQGLDADLRLLRGSWRHDGTEQPNGTRRVDETVHGGLWTIRVEALSETTGSYEVRVEVDPARTIALGDIYRGEDLTSERDSNGYRLDVPERQTVFVQVAPQTAALEVALTIRRGGFAAANPEPVGDGWEVFKTFDPGEYVLIVRSPSGQRGTYEIQVQPDPPSPVPTPTTTEAPGGLIRVPDGVVNVDQFTAESLLTEAGFSVGVWTVCSGSVAEGVVRQLIRNDIEQGEVIVSDLDGVTASERFQRPDADLILKVGTGDVCETQSDS